jgi:zinc transport system substrate-binding protein
LLLPAVALSAPRVVVTIQPLHSLVAGVLGDIAEPLLLIPAAQSPHGYRLRPSDARALNGADLVVWVGNSLETPLTRSIANLSQGATVISALQVDGMALLPTRAGGLHQDDQATGDHDAHHHGSYDPHLWLNPVNGIALVTAVSAQLQRLDPDHARRYRNNAAAVSERLRALDRELSASLAPIRERPFLVLHDAFQYLERRYRLNSIGAIAVSPNRRPGARRLAALHRRLRDSGAVCLFSEPQVSTRTIDQLITGTDTRLGSLDPIGTGIPPGPEAYFTMQERNARSLIECLRP